MKRRSISRWIVVGIAMLALVWAAFPPAIPWDLALDRPQDVVRQFLDDVRAGDYMAARSAWDPASVRNAEKNFGSGFEELCRERFLCDRYAVRPAGTGKNGACVVGFQGEGSGGKKTYSFYLERVRGRWRVVEDLIHPVLPS